MPTSIPLMSEPSGSYDLTSFHGTPSSSGDDESASCRSLYGSHYLQNDLSSSDMEYSSAEEGELRDYYHSALGSFLPSSYVARDHHVHHDGESSSEESSNFYFKANAPQPRSYKYVQKKLPPCNMRKKEDYYKPLGDEQEEGKRMASKSLLKGKVKPMHSNIEKPKASSPTSSIMSRALSSFRRTTITPPVQEEHVVSFESYTSSEPDVSSSSSDPDDEEYDFKETSSDFSLFSGSMDHTSSVEIWETDTTGSDGGGMSIEQDLSPILPEEERDYHDVLKMIEPPLVERKTVITDAFPALQAHSTPASPTRDWKRKFLHPFPTQKRSITGSIASSFDPLHTDLDTASFGTFPSLSKPDSSTKTSCCTHSITYIDDGELPTGLSTRTSTDAVIRKLQLGSVGRRAIAALDHPTKDAGITTNDETKMPMMHIMGVDIPNYDAFVQQSVTKFRRHVLKVSDDHFESLQRRWGPGLAAAQ